MKTQVWEAYLTEALIGYAGIVLRAIIVVIARNGRGGKRDIAFTTGAIASSNRAWEVRAGVTKEGCTR